MEIIDLKDGYYLKPFKHNWSQEPKLTKFKKVQGVGINDADYVVQPQVGEKQVCCIYYTKWLSMLKRCYYDKYQKTQHTYIGCSVCDEWLTFSNFKSWMETQDWEDKELDKDLLVYQNKVYSPETCCFIMKKLNAFLLTTKASRGSFPLGVDYCKGKYRSSSHYGGKQIHLGYFNNPKDAHRAWQKAKAALAFDLAFEQTDERIKQGLMRVYEKILNDYEQGLETKDF